MDTSNTSVLTLSDSLTSTTSNSISIEQDTVVALQSVYTDQTPSALTFAYTDVDTGANTITITGHGLVTGAEGMFSTDDTLPSPLTDTDPFYAIVVDADTIKIASSLANALAGTSIVLTTQGAGNDTFTPSALSGSLQYQVSCDNSNWTNKGSAISISGSGSTMTEWTGAGFFHVRAAYTHTAGQLDLSVHLNAKD